MRIPLNRDPSVVAGLRLTLEQCVGHQEVVNAVLDRVAAMEDTTDLHAFTSVVCGFLTVAYRELLFDPLTRDRDTAVLGLLSLAETTGIH